MGDRQSERASPAPPPPALTSAVWASSYEEVRRLGGKASAERTPVQTLIARYRQAFDLTTTLRYAADAPGRSQVRNARMFALYQMAFDDAAEAMVEASCTTSSGDRSRPSAMAPLTAIRLPRRIRRGSRCSARRTSRNILGPTAPLRR